MVMYRILRRGRAISFRRHNLKVKLKWMADRLGARRTSVDGLPAAASPITGYRLPALLRRRERPADHGLDPDHDPGHDQAG